MAQDVCQLSQIASEILDLFARAHRKPGARMLVSEVEAHVRAAKTPLVSSLTELINAGYVVAPDRDTIELTDRGFDAFQRANYSHLHPTSAPKQPGSTAPATIPEGSSSPSLDPVEEASQESFPASDPPAWTGTIVR